jgi:molybdopterin molybdotransferase
VLPFEAAQLAGPNMLEVLAPVAPGSGIDPVRSSDAPSLIQGRRLRPQDVSCLAAMGAGSVPVLPRPRVALVVAGAKSGPDALTPLLQALLARDEAVVELVTPTGDGEPVLAAALTDPGIAACDLVLVAGRSGAGMDDTAAPALRAAGGTLALHGIALQPGGSCGLGALSAGFRSIPVLLLPGDPLACLVAYDMLAARLVRRLAGAATALPYSVVEHELARKIASGLGITEIVPVRLSGGRAMPIGSDAGLPSAVQADGFVLVAEASEGYPGGARVPVYLYDVTPTAAAKDIVP